MSRLVMVAAMVLATATVAPALAEEAPRPALPFRPQPVVNEAPVPQPALMACETYRITGYTRTAPYHNSRTYDGTPITTPEPIVAASWNLPIDTIVEVADLGRFRVVDRGHLESRHIDVAVWSDAEAFALTGYREVCVLAWGGG